MKIAPHHSAALRAILRLASLLLLLTAMGCTGGGVGEKVVTVPDDALKRASLRAFVDSERVQQLFTIQALTDYCHEDFVPQTDLGSLDANGPFIDGALDDRDGAATPFALELRPDDAHPDSYTLIRFGSPEGRPVPPTDEDWARVLDAFIASAVLDGDIVPEFDRFTKLALKEYSRAQMSYYIDKSSFAATTRQLTKYGVSEPPYSMRVNFIVHSGGNACLMLAQHAEGNDIFACNLPSTDITASREEILLATIRAASSDPIELITPILTGLVDLDATNEDGKTALNLAEEKAFPQTLRALVDYMPPES